MNLDRILADLPAMQDSWTEAWHIRETRMQEDALLSYIQRNHWHNFQLWHEEDVARREDLPPERIRDAKRVIDRNNQLRNDAVECIDEVLSAELPMKTTGRRHSETPGMMIDRLSILSLKIYHMNEQTRRTDVSATHVETCARRLSVLLEQRLDLHASLLMLLAEIRNGQAWFKLYRQFKMYNDPALNPQLYAKRSEA